MKTRMEKFKLTHLERSHRDRIVAHSHSNKTETRQKEEDKTNLLHALYFVSTFVITFTLSVLRPDFSPSCCLMPSLPLPSSFFVFSFSSQTANLRQLL